jgi:hypothetical protein
MAAAVAAAKTFHLWKVAHFQNSNVAANDADCPSLLDSSPSGAATGAVSFSA